MVFKIYSGRLALLVATLALCATARLAAADEVYWTAPKLLTSFFPQAKRVTYRKLTLTADDRARVGKRLGYLPAKPAYTLFVALDDKDHTVGYALIDDERGQHMPITFAVKLDLAGVVQRQEIMVYRETRGDEVRDARFRRQFVGKSAKDAIATGDDIVAVSGATISSGSMAVGVRRAVILFDELVLRARPLPGEAGGRAQAAAASTR